MARAKPTAPRQIGADTNKIDNLALSRLAPEEKCDTYDHQGTVAPIKQRKSLFIALRDTGTLSGSQSASAGRLMEVYTRLAQVGEAPERRDVEDYFGWEELHPAQVAILRAKGVIRAESEYRRVCRQIGPHSAALLTMLFRDFLEGDHEAPVKTASGKPIARWRVKVRAFYKARGKVLTSSNEENLAVWIACDELQRTI